MNFNLALQDLNSWIKDTMAWFSNSTSAMELHTAVICAGVFVISALVVYLISVFGMRERTYEEAIEEQRRRNQEAIQQAKTDKSKKDKKFKKWGKKSKEKSEEEKSVNCDAEKVSEENETKSEVDSNNSISNTNDIKVSNKKKTRQRKSVMQEKSEVSQHQSSSEETDDLTSASNSISSNVPVNEDEKSTHAEKLEKSVQPKEEFKNQNSESSLDLGDEKIEDSMKTLRKSPTKKNRKSKGENSETNHNMDNTEWNEAKFLNIIKQTNFSEEEVQHLTDALNSKVKGNPAEKRKNEVSSLKKIIQEKEEALRSEQKLYQSATEQINDLIQELNEKKAQTSATEKSLRDALNQEQQEIKALHGMMQRKREQYASELAAMQSKMQQLKNKMKEEHSLALQRLQEENNQLQSLNRIESEKQQRSSMEITRLQHEIEQLRSSREKFETHQAAMQQSQEDLHHQIQQLEKHIEQLTSSHQEEKYSYNQRINELSNKIQQTENARSSLVQELQNAQSVCSSLEADNSSLRQRLDEAKHQLNTSEQEIMKLQNRLEEVTRQQREMANCLEKMREEVIDLTNVKHEQLQVIQNLKQENESLASQISQSIERMSADGAEEQQNEEMAEKPRLINAEEHDCMIREKETIVNQLLQEVEQCKKEIVSLSKDLDCQKERNKEINEEKNKLLAALSTSEKKIQEVIQSTEKKVQEAQAKADSSSKDMQNILNEQIKEMEQSLHESYAKEILSMKEEAENIKKEAEERILKAENEANMRLEEFQESLYERLDKINLESEEKIKDAVREKELVQKELKNFANSVKEFLCRIFPNIAVPQTIDNKLCITEYEKEVVLHLEKLKTEVRQDSKDLENMIKKLEENAAEKLNLEAQIKNYEIVLAETESILKTLQNNVESEEKKWKKELQSKDECLKEVFNENEKLKSQNRTMQTNLEQLQDLKEALYEIEELRLKLQKEELEKKLLQEKLGQLDSQLTNSSNLPVSDHLAQIPEVNGASGKK